MIVLEHRIRKQLGPQLSLSLTPQPRYILSILSCCSSLIYRGFSRDSNGAKSNKVEGGILVQHSKPLPVTLTFHPGAPVRVPTTLLAAEPLANVSWISR